MERQYHPANRHFLLEFEIVCHSLGNFLKIEGVLYASASVQDVTERKTIDDKLTRDIHMQRGISEVLKPTLKAVSLQEQLDTIQVRTGCGK